MRALARYAEANAIIRASLSDLLSRSQFDDILRAGTFQESWNALRSTAYAAWLPELSQPSPLMAERALKDATGSRFKRALRSLRGKTRDVGSLLLSRWELDDLHEALRAWHGKDETYARLVPSVSLAHDVPFLEVAKADTLETVAALLRGTPYADPVLESARTYRETRTLFHLEIALEKRHYRSLLNAIKNLGGNDATDGLRLIAAEIDLVNLSWLSRCASYYGAPAALLREAMIPNISALSSTLEKAQFSPEDLEEVSLQYLSELAGDKGGNPPGLERIGLLESLVTESATDAAWRQLAGFPFCIACVIAFYSLTRTELRNLRGIFAGLAAGFSPEELSGKLCGIR